MQCRCEEIAICDQDIYILNKALAVTGSIDAQMQHEEDRKSKIISALPIAEEDENISFAIMTVNMCGKRQGRSVCLGNSAWQGYINESIGEIEAIKEEYIIEDIEYHNSQNND